MKDLRESQQLRLMRLYPGTVVKDALGTILVPVPTTARVGGRPLRDLEVVAWARQLITAVLLDDIAAGADVTKVAGVAGVDKVTVDGYGAAAQKVPFTAGLDEQGRLSALTIQLPPVNGQQAAPIEVLYTDYGLPVESLRPDPSTVVEAPESLYTTLGGR